MKVFPSAQRPWEQQRDARLWTETNITNIIKSICNVSGATYKISDTEFVCDGYYFKFDSAPTGTKTFYVTSGGELYWEGTATDPFDPSSYPSGAVAHTLNCSTADYVRFQQNALPNIDLGVVTS